ncbi:MAG: PfkB family carbohydrate kinase [Chloroflexota bacterium]
MIVVVGNPIARAPDSGGGLAGVPAEAAAAAARAGATVQLVGKAGEDRAGDDLMLALARAGVGHVALLRDAAHATPIVAAVDQDDELGDAPGSAPSVIPADPAERPSLDAADVELALRYLQDYTTVVIAEPQPNAVMTIVVDAASFVGAALLLVVDRAADGSEPPASAVVFEAPGSDPDGAFATMLGELAAAIDRGTPVGAAFREVEGRLGLTPARE